MTNPESNMDSLVREFYLLKAIVEDSKKDPNSAVPLKPGDCGFLEMAGLALPLTDEPKTTKDYMGTFSARRVYEYIFNRKI